MKKHLLFLFASLLPLLASAQDKVEIDGIWYNFIDESNVAKVTFKGYSYDEYNEYSGNITIPATVTHEGAEYAVTSIESSAFAGCSDLTAITIPESMTSIEDQAFDYCTGLKELIIEDGSNTLSIGSTYYVINGGITIITYTNLFYYAPLETLYLGRNLSYDSFSPFSINETLTSVIIGDNVTSIGSEAFAYCSNLTAITIPNGVTSIGEEAFEGCSSLTAITIPNGVTSIGEEAFEGCSSLTEVTFGKGLKKIASKSFSECEAIKKITIHATQPPTTDGYIFDDVVYENAMLYVPNGCVSKYQVMTGWSGFYNISVIVGSTPEYLTIRQADNGEVGIAVDLGRTYKVRIAPSTGWQIHSVTLDGKDMTAQLAEDNTFTTPTLNTSAVLNVAYVKENSAINDTHANKAIVRGHNGIISICGAAEGAAITIYTLNGAMVANAIATAETTSIEVPTHQVYIVMVADKVVKIGM